MTLEDALKVLAIIIVVGSQVKAFFDGSNDRKARKESDDLLTNRLSELRKDLTTLTQTRTDLEKEVKSFKDELARQEGTAKQLRTDFDQSQGVIQSLEREKNRLEESNRLLNERIAVEINTRESVSNELTTLRGEYIELRRKYDQLSNKLTIQENEVSMLKKDNNTLSLYLIFLKYSPSQIDAIKAGKYQEVFYEWNNFNHANSGNLEKSQIPTGGVLLPSEYSRPSSATTDGGSG